ncbi:MAG: hypothetical protein MUF18_19265 [Fimbriiglobus sp.]|jgi:Spy/CpxP family protein refolding chaperone|nr:hypothetical protein [Fimbriiglobus sp.]
MKWQLAAAVAVVAVAGVASAQQRQPGGMGRGMQQQSLYMLALTNADLQSELKITDEQKKGMKELVDKAADLTKKRQEAFTGGQIDREKMQELTQAATKLAEEAKTSMEKALTDDQKKRIKQIDVQRKGFAAFSDEEVAKAMKLTDDQKAKMKTLGEEMQKARGELARELGIGGGGGQRPDPEKMAELTKKSAALATETMEKAKKELTDDQKKTWTDLTGPAFDVSKLQQRPMRRDN